MPTDNLSSRLAAIEARLERIESELKIKKTSAPASPESTFFQVPAFDNKSAPAKTTNASNTASAAVEAVPPSKPGNWLGIISILCFVLAAGFIIKLSIDTGWLTPVRQVFLAAIFGFSLIAVGMFAMKSDREYASLLPAAGIIILYLALFAAYSYYYLISDKVALIGIISISILCIWIYTKLRHDIYPLIAAVGAYLGPLLLNFTVQSLFTLYYLVICSLTFAFISIWVRSRTLTVVAAYLALMANALVGIDYHHDALMSALLPIHLLIFGICAYVYSLRTHKPLTSKEAWSFFPVLLLFYALEYYFIYKVNPHAAPWISLGCAAFIIGLYISAKGYFPQVTDNSRGMLIAFATIVLFHSVYLEMLPDDVRPWLFVFFVIAANFIPPSVSTAENRSVYLLPRFAIGLILILEYINICYRMIAHTWNGGMLLGTAAFAAMWFMIAMKNPSLQKEEDGLKWLSLAHIMGIIGLDQLADPYGSFAVSLSWLLYAICVISFAYYRKDKIMARSAILILGFAAGKALLYDASSAPTLVRIGCLLVTGIVLYGAGFLFRRINLWDKPKKLM